MTTFPILTIKDAAALPGDREITIRLRDAGHGKWRNPETLSLSEWMEVARNQAHSADHEINESSAEACLRYILADAVEYRLSDDQADAKVC